MSRLDAIVLAAGSLGLAANLALSQPKFVDGVLVGADGTTLNAVDRASAKGGPLHQRPTDGKPGGRTGDRIGGAWTTAKP